MAVIVGLDQRSQQLRQGGFFGSRFVAECQVL